MTENSVTEHLMSSFNDWNFTVQHRDQEISSFIRWFFYWECIVLIIKARIQECHFGFDMYGYRIISLLVRLPKTCCVPLDLLWILSYTSWQKETQQVQGKHIRYKGGNMMEAKGVHSRSTRRPDVSGSHSRPISHFWEAMYKPERLYSPGNFEYYPGKCFLYQMYQWYI